MTEVLVAVLALALGATVAFFLMYQYFSRRIAERAEAHRREVERLETQVRELTHALAGGRTAP